MPYPGSTFKLLVAVAALREGLSGPQLEFDCQRRYQPVNSGMTLHCEGTHGLIGLHKALRVSCNVYFYKLAESLGYEPLYDWLIPSVGVDICYETFPHTEIRHMIFHTTQKFLNSQRFLNTMNNQQGIYVSGR